MAPEKITFEKLLLALVVVLAVEISAVWIARAHVLPSLVILGAARLLEGGLLLSVLKTRDAGFESIGLDRGRIGSGLKSGLIWSAVFGFAALVGLAALNWAGLEYRRFLAGTLPAGPYGAALFFIVGGLISPLAEEIFFRGAIYTFFRRWGWMAALLISTILFVLPHMASGRLPLTQIVGGIVFGLAYEKSGSLAAPITIHVLGNLAIFSLFYIYQ